MPEAGQIVCPRLFPRSWVSGKNKEAWPEGGAGKKREPGSLVQIKGFPLEGGRKPGTELMGVDPLAGLPLTSHGSQRRSLCSSVPCLPGGLDLKTPKVPLEKDRMQCLRGKTPGFSTQSSDTESNARPRASH